MGNLTSKQDNTIVVPFGTYINRSWLKKNKTYEAVEPENDFYDLESLFYKPVGGGRNLFTLHLCSWWHKIHGVGLQNSIPNIVLLNSLFTKTSYYEIDDKPLIYSVDKYVDILNRKGLHLEESSFVSPVKIRTHKLSYELYSPRPSNIFKMISNGNILLGVINTDVEKLKDILFSYKDRYNFKINVINGDNLSDLISICGIKNNSEECGKTELKIKFWWMSDWVWVSWDKLRSVLKEVWLINVKEDI